MSRRREKRRRAGRNRLAAAVSSAQLLFPPPAATKRPGRAFAELANTFRASGTGQKMLIANGHLG